MPTVDVVAQQLINAVTLSAMYALIALGVSLFFGTIGVVNLAHGDVSMIGAFAGLAAFRFIESTLGRHSLVTAALIAFFFATLASMLVGWAINRLAFKPLRGAPPIIGLLSSIGVGFVLRESVLNFFPDGRNPQPFPSLIPASLYQFSGVIVQTKQIVIVGGSIALVMLLSTLIEGTRFGRSMRSIVNNQEVSKLLGVKVEGVIARTFVLGSALAGIAGALNAVYYNIIQFDMGLLLTVKGFTAAVIGGLGNVYGAVVGAFLVGIIEAFTAGFLPDGSAYKDIAVFGTLTLVLIFRPEGILSLKGAEKV